MKALRGIFSVFIALLFFSQAFASEVKFPALTGQVVDEAGVLTPQTKALVLKLLSADKDNQIVVVLVKSLQGLDGRAYGIELARRWQLGQKGKDNGVLILFATDDRYVGIEVGYGLEGILTDSVSGRILREVVFPELKGKANYNQAVINAVSVVMGVISQGKLQNGDDDEMPFGDILYLIFILVMIYLSASGRGPRGGGMLLRGLGRFGRGGGFSGGGGSFGGGGSGGRF